MNNTVCHTVSNILLRSPYITFSIIINNKDHIFSLSDRCATIVLHYSSTGACLVSPFTLMSFHSLPCPAVTCLVLFDLLACEISLPGQSRGSGVLFFKTVFSSKPELDMTCSSIVQLINTSFNYSFLFNRNFHHLEIKKYQKSFHKLFSECIILVPTQSVSAVDLLYLLLICNSQH